MRNYEKESQWAAKKYGQLAARLDKDMVNAFKEKLKASNETYADWLHKRITEYLGED